MNRQQRRAHAKVGGEFSKSDRLEVDRVVAYFKDGRQSTLDMTKLQIIKRDTGEPLFDFVQEGEAV